MDPGERGERPAGYAVAAVDADLGVLLAELNRVRADRTEGGHGGPDAAEAITLASAAIRLVETQLQLQSRADMTAEDLELARSVLRGALEVLRAALDRAAQPPIAAGPARGRRWGRRGRPSPP